jgi:hypothetical protein
MRTMPDGSLKSRFGRGYDWSDISLSKRAEFVDDALKKRFSRKSFKSTLALYHAIYKDSAAYLHGMLISVGRSIDYDSGSDRVMGDGRVEMTCNIRVKDKNPKIAVEALGAANLAAGAILLFVGKVFGLKSYPSWVLSFSSSHREEMRTARNPAS